MREDWLPGDGSLQAIRDEHEQHRRLQVSHGGMHPRVNPYCFARIEFLLAEVDRLNATLNLTSADHH